MSNKIKKAIRARMAKTGEAYSTARMHVLASAESCGETSTVPAIDSQRGVILEAHPDLCLNGFRDGQLSPEKFAKSRADLKSACALRQIEDCLAYLALLPNTRSAKPSEGRVSCGSYRMKHEVEAWLGQCRDASKDNYVANGAFIVAVMIAGFRFHREERRTPNCLIGVDAGDVRALRKGKDPREWRKKTRFVTWLFGQAKRSDPTGELARDCEEDFDFPRRGNIAAIRAYLSQYGVHIEDAFNEAYSEYRSRA